MDFNLTVISVINVAFVKKDSRLTIATDNYTYDVNGNMVLITTKHNGHNV